MSDAMHWSGIWLEPFGFYLATGLPDCYPGGEQPFTVNSRSGALTIWGFSIYRRVPAYRTLGIDLREFLERHPGVVVAPDRDRRKDPKPKRTPKVPPLLRTIVDTAELERVNADITQLRADLRGMERMVDEMRGEVARVEAERDTAAFGRTCAVRDCNAETAALVALRARGEALAIAAYNYRVVAHEEQCGGGSCHHECEVPAKADALDAALVAWRGGE